MTEKSHVDINMLVQKIDLDGERSDRTQLYIAQHEVVSYASNGRQKRVDSYSLHMMCEPGNRSVGEADRYTCRKFSLKMDGDSEVLIPSLAGWSYDFSTKALTSEGLDSEGLMLGIPHDKFENMTDDTGATLSIEAQYQVYSAFIYFHSWCNMLAEQGARGLKKIGDVIVNDESSLEHPINLGSKFLEGSKFIHGIETLAFKGLSVVDGASCAILSADERGGGYVMHMKPMPVLQVKTVGATRFSGDIYIDLTSLWVKKVTASVTDITQTTMFGIPVDTTVPVTTLTIKSVMKDELDQD
jgi:hypothetical protein